MDDVTVRIFLAGSHEHTWRCSQDHPSIRTLMGALSANAHPSHHDAGVLVRLVVPTEGGGERGLVFLRHSLVAVETDPAMVDEMPTIHSARQAMRARVARGEQVTERPRFVTVLDLFPRDVHDEILAWMIENEADFLASGVNSGPDSAADDYDFRRSRVNMKTGRWRKLFEDKLQLVLPGICARLEVPMPDRPHLELQMTQHGHMDRFKTHMDNVTGTLRQRVISLVYYLHRRPRPFKGGELVLWDKVRDGDGKPRQGEGFRVLEPEANTLVAFPSDFYHQVRTVRMPDGAFGDGRFTVNGWLRDLDRA